MHSSWSAIGLLNFSAKIFIHILVSFSLKFSQCPGSLKVKTFASKFKDL